MKLTWILAGGALLLLAVTASRLFDPSQEDDSARRAAGFVPAALAADDHDDHDHGATVAQEDAGHDHADADGDEPGADGHDGHDGAAIDGHAVHEDGDADEHAGHDHSDGEDGVLRLTAAQQAELAPGWVRATRSGLSQERRLPGEIVVNGDRLAHVVPRVAGVVLEVWVSEGDRVRAGQPLARLESSELAERAAAWAEADSRLRWLQETHERRRALRDDGLLSESDWWSAEAERQAAGLAAEAAKNRLRVLGADPDSLALRLREQPERLGELLLRAPLDGTVIDRHLTVGEHVEADSDVFAVADLSRLWVEFRAPEALAAALVPGSRLVVEETDATLELRVDRVAPLVDAETRTVRVRALLPNPDGDWRPGRFLEASWRGSGPAQALSLPAACVQRVDGEEVVFVARGDGFAATPVRTGRRDGERVEILGGLADGERVVSRGAWELKALLATAGLGGHAGHGH